MQSLSTKLRTVIAKTLSVSNKRLIHFTSVCSDSYLNSPYLVDVGDVKIKYEVTSVPEDWKYVERLLPPVVIPDPVAKPEYPSGWKPQATDLTDRPYYVHRTKNHMLPVYMIIKEWGQKRLTIVRKVQGDIWLLEKELRKFLQPSQIKPIRSQVHELAGFILFHGDHVNAIKHYLLERKY